MAMGQNENIKASRRNVMMRISVFLLYYILLLIFTFILFLLALGVTVAVILNISAFLNRLGLIIVAVLFSCWTFVIKVGYGLLKSPFIVTRYERTDHMEVTEKNYPQLFKIIREVASFTGCEMPKHVFLCSDVNACLFYNTSFWNIFIPVKKQLEIGVGLMNGMSTEELKAIIAHEFGHYSQKTDKIDGIINRAITILDNMMKNIALPSFLQKLTFKVYRFVERGNLRFSRQLEYNADAVACSCVGKDVFISAMCKVEILGERQNLYEQFMSNLLDEGKQCMDYWGCYDSTLPYIEDNDNIKLEYDKPLEKPFKTPSNYPSRLKVNNIWSTHPSLEDRVSEAGKASTVSSKDGRNKVDARTLIDPATMLAIGAIRVTAVKTQNSLTQEMETITCEQYGAWAEENHARFLIPGALVGFLRRDFFSLVDAEKLKNADSIEANVTDPFTAENLSIIRRYQGAVNDQALLQSIKSGSYEVTEFLYNGVLHNRSTAPVKEQSAVVEGLRPQAALIDNAIFSFVLSKAESRSEVLKYYEMVHYVSRISSRLAKLVEIRDAALARLNAAASNSEIEQSEYRVLLDEVKGLSISISAVTKELKYDLLSEVLNSVSISYLANYHKKYHCSSATIKPNQVNAMSRLVDILYTLHRNLYNQYTEKIISAVQMCFPAESQRDLMEHILAQPDSDDNMVQKRLDADYMERVKKSESWTIGFYLLGELAVFIAIFLSFKIVYSYISPSRDNIPWFSEISVCDGEQSDGVIAFKIPEGYECQQFEKSEESAGGFLLTSEDCTIEIYDGFASAPTQEECFELYKSFAKERGLWTEPPYIIDSYNFKYKVRSSDLFRRLARLYDNGGNEMRWDFRIRYHYEEKKYAIVSTIKSGNFLSGLDFADNIRLK